MNLAYYGNELNASVKGFTIQALGPYILMKVGKENIGHLLSTWTMPIGDKHSSLNYIPKRNVTLGAGAWVGAGRGFLGENESRMYDIQTFKEMRKRLIEVHQDVYG